MSTNPLPDIRQVVVNGNDGLNRAKHITYWKRCLRTFLPHQYTSSESYRLMFAYFTLAALDLLGILHSDTKEEERRGWIDWVYSCQVPEGGFRGGPFTDPKERRNAQSRHWDPPSVPGTYFALAALLLLGDDLERVKRKECLEFLYKMQRPDGSFGETLGKNDQIEGDRDTRFGYTAMGIRWILRGRAQGEVLDVKDIDVDKFVKCIRLAEAYDGGISEVSYHEAHGGFTFCAIAALYFAGRLPPGIYPDHFMSDQKDMVTAPSDLDFTIHWLLSRQTLTLDEEDEEDTYGDEADTKDTCHDAHSTMVMQEFVSKNGEQNYNHRPSHLEYQWVGYNGRANKIADTCYTWWVCGSLDILKLVHLCDVDRSRRYLLDKTQHAIGGFGKLPGYPPDIYHSYLGLAALSLLKHPNLKSTHAAACISWDAVRHLEALPWRQNICDQPEEDGPMHN